MPRSFVLKIIIMGDGGVGKTTLLIRYMEGKFVNDTSLTIGVQFYSKNVKIGNDNVTLQLWDFAGQDQFRYMLKDYVIGVKGAILMFDLTRFQTLGNLEEWINLCRRDNPDLPIILIGGKAELTNDITIEDNYPLQLIEELNLFDYIKVSSKTGRNVNEAFETLVKKIMSRVSY